MPVRSINLKIVVPRRPERRQLARNLWTTHAAINEAVAYYESHLLRMRGEPYTTNGTTVSRADVQGASGGLLAEVRKRNGAEPLPAEAIAHACVVLRQLYVAIVPSAVGKEGNAQTSNAYLGPLTDPQSRGFEHVFEKVDSPPDWVQGVRDGVAESFDIANEWLQSDSGQIRLRATGAPPTWVRRARANDPSWPTAFVQDLDKKLAEVAGVPSLIRELRELKVLPLFPPLLAPRIAESRGTLGPWDRLAFRLAVGHLLSWESWCRLAAQEHGHRQAKLSAFRERHLGADFESAVQLLRAYEIERHEELARCGLPMERPFRITRRMVRGWGDLREKWLKAKGADASTLKDIIAGQQTRLRGRFGDPHLFRWLAEPAHHGIWSDPARDAVTLVAHLNAMEALVERSRETATMTLPDARMHPRSVQWEAEGGSNLKNYRLRPDGAAGLQAVLPLLSAGEDGKFREVTETVSLAPSGQFRDVEFSGGSKAVRVRYRGTSGETYVGQMGAADLLMNWDHLRHRPLELVEHGDIGPAYLKVSLDLQSSLPEGWNGKRPRAINHLLSAAGQKTKYAEDLAPGLRVLSVDLGVRAFATCSVFELRDEPSERTISFAIDGAPLWATHERSFILSLPDEHVDRRGELWREAARTELRDLRRALGRYRGMYRLTGLTPTERAAQLDDLNSAAADAKCWPFESELMQRLRDQCDVEQAAWDQCVQQTRVDFRQGFAAVVHQWRARTRERSRYAAMGKSMWALDHLGNVRRFLMSWSLLGRASGDIQRLDKERRGVFASGLLAHIDAIKEDRLKTGADLIVQAARGYLRNADGRWTQLYKPCHVVLFEDLSRYRMLTDRPRRENSQLMKWAHRSVPAEVAMQGELYGLHVVDTGAAFSSRYHAATHTPGIRCHALRAKDLEDAAFMELLQRENPGYRGTFTAGALVPLAGGEWFVCPSSTGVTRVHADINAAQNLQRRFWTRHRDAFRMVTLRVDIDGAQVWVPRSLGKRLLGGLGGHGYLVPTGAESGACRWEQTSAGRWGRLAGSEAAASAESSESADLEELVGLEDEALERSGEVVVFFRDPSGVTLPKHLWYPQKTFWSIVKARTIAALSGGG